MVTNWFKDQSLFSLGVEKLWFEIRKNMSSSRLLCHTINNGSSYSAAVVCTTGLLPMFQSIAFMVHTPAKGSGQPD